MRKKLTPETDKLDNLVKNGQLRQFVYELRSDNDHIFDTEELTLVFPDGTMLVVTGAPVGEGGDVALDIS